MNTDKMITPQAACDFICTKLSPSLFDLALDIVFQQVTTSIRSNSARVVSQLTSCFARANSAKTLAKFLPICDINIRIELEQGASSTRTTSTSTQIDSDVTLHWWIGLLTGAVTNGADVRPTFASSYRTITDATYPRSCSRTRSSSPPSSSS